MQAFAISFGVIFVAELGDKSQLMALAFATRFPAWRVLIGITDRDRDHPRCLGGRRPAGGRPPAHRGDHDRRRPRVPRVRGVDAAGRHPGRGRRDGRGQGRPAGRGRGHRRHRRHVPARRARATRPCSPPSRSPPGRASFGTWLGSTLGMVAADALAIVVGHQLGVAPARTGRTDRRRHPLRRVRAGPPDRGRPVAQPKASATLRVGRFVPMGRMSSGSERGGGISPARRRLACCANARPEDSSTPRRRRRQWGSDRRVAPLPAYTRPPIGPGRRRQPAGDGGHGGGLDRLRRHHDHPAVHQQRHAEHALHQRSGLLPGRGDPADQLGHGLPGGPARVPRAGPAPTVGRPERPSTTTSAARCPTLTVLVPSYKEEARVIRQTLLSAALQEYPFQRIVLLIDDPPDPTDARRPAAARRRRMALPGQIDGAARRAARAGRGRARRPRAPGRRRPGAHRRATSRRPRRPTTSAADWLRGAGRPRDRVGGRPHRRLPRRPRARPPRPPTCGPSADAIAAAVADGHRPRRRTACSSSTGGWCGPSAPRWRAFERKRYVSLSHEPNKAMNLNSYIGLIGGGYREVETPSGGCALVPRRRRAARPRRPRPRLRAHPRRRQRAAARVLPAPRPPAWSSREHSDVAVAQTPYSSYPGSATRLERLAGATTDLQHIVHQGMTHYDATFWVGANAVLRKARARRHRDDRRARRAARSSRYIQDRTVIEDTESSIDLGVHGWRLLQLPGAAQLQRHAAGLRLAEHPAPALGQRRPADPAQAAGARSATAGARGERSRLGELFLRVNYMASICWAQLRPAAPAGLPVQRPAAQPARRC